MNYPGHTWIKHLLALLCSSSCKHLSTTSPCCSLGLDKLRSSGYDTWWCQLWEGFSDTIKTRQLWFEPLANCKTLPMRLGIWKILVLPAVITSHLLRPYVPSTGRAVCLLRQVECSQIILFLCIQEKKSHSYFSGYSSSFSYQTHLPFDEMTRLLHMNNKYLWLQLPTLPHLKYVELNGKKNVLNRDR